MRLPIVTVVALLATVIAFAADVSGTWTASFDTQVGVQNYTYTFKAEGSTLTGKIKSQNGESDVKEGKINGDEISFVENLVFQDMPLRIEYKGKISGDEIKFTRKVADVATEELVAKRAK